VSCSFVSLLLQEHLYLSGTETAVASLRCVCVSNGYVGGIQQSDSVWKEEVSWEMDVLQPWSVCKKHRTNVDTSLLVYLVIAQL